MRQRPHKKQKARVDKMTYFWIYFPFLTAMFVLGFSIGHIIQKETTITAQPAHCSCPEQTVDQLLQSCNTIWEASVKHKILIDDYKLEKMR